ncbi:hypothetical protein [Methanosalsum natronophilum]|uniref:Uncharacterized protein n=1 Tax=Methanosalsum natronophilum TaxID=768733 RepID=A0A424YX99_9EURY|nr:hypothetical protein [Methanosalsum natronophilum]MCS3924578.1 hypothetical protein [Methanosalsum natronophilum]RQD84865.1 MAG: hypothetical protein D5R95_05590 [Methanosalsum natronophilum]
MKEELSSIFLESLLELEGEYIRVLTIRSEYRGMCKQINPVDHSLLLKEVVEKRDDGWVEISNLMFIPGKSIITAYIDTTYPFDTHESLILSVKDGELNDYGVHGEKEEDKHNTDENIMN